MRRRLPPRQRGGHVSEHQQRSRGDVNGAVSDDCRILACGTPHRPPWPPSPLAPEWPSWLYRTHCECCPAVSGRAHACALPWGPPSSVVRCRRPPPASSTQARLLPLSSSWKVPKVRGGGRRGQARGARADGRGVELSVMGRALGARTVGLHGGSLLASCASRCGCTGVSNTGSCAGAPRGVCAYSSNGCGGGERMGGGGGLAGRACHC